MRSRLNKRRTRRKNSVKSYRSGNLSPLLKLLGTLFGGAAAIALLVFGIMFILEAFFKIDTPLNASGIIGKFAGKINTPLIESPTPIVTAEPTPTPNPMEGFEPAALQRELILPGELNYPWLADPYCFDGTVICSAGKLFDGKVKLQKLVQYDISTGNVSELGISPLNDHLLNPVFNEKWLVYFDANYNYGGGEIRCVNRLSASSAPQTIKTVYVGQPQISLDGDLITWIERTGSEREKIFACDLSTGENVTVDYFDNHSSGTSAPDISHGRLVWSAPASFNDSCVKYYDVALGTSAEFRPGLFVHDPKFNGKYFAWLDSPHADGAKLYISDGVSGSTEIAADVISFDLDEEFAAYSVEDAVYIYLFETGETYRITSERESAQLLGVSGGVIFFMDVTSRERDIIKYMPSPLRAQATVSENEG